MKPVHSHRCWVEINLAALERNLQHIRAALPARIKYVAVVKADAYGHGFQQTVARLMQAGADIFAVANIEEAMRIEEIGAGWPILILSPLLPQEIDTLLDHDWLVTISTREELDLYQEIGKIRGHAIKAHLKVDTGMGRLGVWHTEAPELYRYAHALTHVQICGVYTHFSSADRDPEYTATQRDRFITFLEQTDIQPGPHCLVHADNSAGLATFHRDSPFNAVRIGLLQFGIQPYQDSALAKVKVEPVFSFHARVALVKKLPAGTPISYGKTHILKEPSTIAILTAGYADGVPFPTSGSGEVLIHGTRCRILGRVTMDQTIVDVSALSEVSPGDHAILVGSQKNETVTLQEFSNLGHTIPWETMTSITKRVQRVYKTARNL